ncbi:MAG TPA: thermonuclease family protein [Candidatus Obscuribacterales bacterium]
MKFRKGSFCLVALLLGAHIGARLASVQAGPALTEGQVLRVLDGDSLVCKSGNRALNLRLWGIDAPERGQPLAAESRTRLAALVMGKPVGLLLKGKDRYGRTIARLQLPDGSDAGERMVRAGLAWWYRHYAPHDKALAALEQEARLDRRGLWALPAPVPPWEFRHGKASRQVKAFD